MSTLHDESVSESASDDLNLKNKAVIAADDGRSITIMTMGPICIAPELKRKGYGKILLDYSLEKAKELGCGAVCFEGNIDFYGKSGFKQASEFGIRYHGLPEGEDASFFLYKELIPAPSWAGAFWIMRETALLRWILARCAPTRVCRLSGGWTRCSTTHVGSS